METESKNDLGIPTWHNQGFYKLLYGGSEGGWLTMIAAPGRAGLGVEKARLGKPESLNRDLYHGCAVWQGVVLGVGAAEDL